MKVNPFISFKFLNYIFCQTMQVYVVKVNPLNTPSVVAALIDLDCSEDFIKNILQMVRSNWSEFHFHVTTFLYNLCGFPKWAPDRRNSSNLAVINLL